MLKEFSLWYAILLMHCFCILNLWALVMNLLTNNLSVLGIIITLFSVIAVVSFWMKPRGW